MYITFVIPVFNEENNVPLLHAELLEVIKKINKKCEIIFVDDGSSDQTPQRLQTLKPVKVVRLSRNFGQTAALDAGIKAATGQFIVTLDGDLQNNPDDVISLLDHLNETNADVVCGWRQKRRDSFSKRFISNGARFLRSFLINDGIHDSGCTLRVYKRACFDNIELRGEMHRFIPAILKWQGFKIVEYPVNHRARVHGQSKYSLSRTIKGFLDMLTLWFFHKYVSRPLHFLGSIGLLFFGSGGTLFTGLLIARLFFNYSLSDRIWSLVSIFFMLFGFQMFVSGLTMDLILRSTKNTFYFVKETYESE